MDGSFAGGLADGMRNGMAIARAYDDSAETRRRRDVDKKLAAQMLEADPLQGNPDTRRQLAEPGLQRIDVPQPVNIGAQAVGGVGGLQPIASPGLDSSAVTARPEPVVGQSAGLGGQGMSQWRPGLDTAVRPSGATQKKSPGQSDYLGAGDFGEVADGLTRAYRKALELGEPGRALDMLMQREKFAGQHRQDAFAAAQSKFQLTGDPSAFVPFVNRFMPGGIEVQSITRRPETAGGAPMYEFAGVDSATGKEVRQPFTEHMLQSFVASISDPKAQQAMVAQQAKQLFDAAQTRQNKMLDSRLRSDEELRKPRVLGKDQTLYVPNGKGGMDVGAQGSEAGKPKMVTSDKDFASHVMRLFKVDSIEGLGEDERKRVGGIIATGENINRLNAGTAAGKVLTAGNLAALSQQVQDGDSNVVPIEFGDGQFGFGVEYEGELVRLPVSVVPAGVQADIRRRILTGSAQAQGAGQTVPTGSATEAAPMPPAQAPSSTARPAPAERAAPAANSAEGAQLDAARAELRQAQGLVRQLRTKPPGLKASREARVKHAEQLQQAERDVELARVAERAAAERWARVSEGSDITRAAMGRTTAE